MRLFKIIALWVLLVFIVSCNQPVQERKSRLEQFAYGGYGDTIYATLYGQVFLDSPAITPLPNALITVQNNGKQLKTDSLGTFELYSDADTFALEIYYPGYQTLILKNYISHPDQISTARMILTKGKGVEEVIIPSEAPNR